jgi:hypothetical protein
MWEAFPFGSHPFVTQRKTRCSFVDVVEIVDVVEKWCWLSRKAGPTLHALWVIWHVVSLFPCATVGNALHPGSDGSFVLSALMQLCVVTPRRTGLRHRLSSGPSKVSALPPALLLRAPRREGRTAAKGVPRGEPTSGWRGRGIVWRT